MPDLPDLDDLKKMADEHDAQIDQGLDTAGKAAASKFGHEEQIDEAVKKAQDATGPKDTQK